MECRICLEDDTTEPLINPCACDGTTKWVHESCLQRWREENMGLDNATRCEICKTEYIIERDVPLETYTNLYEGFGFCGEMCFGYIFGWFTGALMWALDTSTNYTSIHIFNLQSLNLTAHMKEDAMITLSYYQGMSAWSLSSIAFLILLINIHINIKRKETYYCRIFPILLLTSLVVNSFLFILLAALDSNNFVTIALWSPASSTIQFHAYFNYVRNHNRIVRIMNGINIGERILSLGNRSSTYRPTRRFEIENMV